jgi:dipeptidyl aminopeptidase/acylaminoacyl peptidase
VDDYFTLGLISEVAISPDGTKVAYSEGRWQESTNDRKSDLWLVAAKGGAPTRLTFERANYANLRWSPDGKFLFFTCSRKRPGEDKPPFDGSSQVWRLAADGNEPVAMTRAAGGVTGYDLSAGGNWLAYTTSADSDAGDWSALRARFSAVQYGTRKRGATSLFKLDLQTWRVSKLVELPLYVDEFALSSDDKTVALITAADGVVITLEGKSKMTILDLPSGRYVDLPDEQWRKDAPSPYGQLQRTAWSADGKALAFAIGFDAYPSEVFVAAFEEGKPPVISKVPRPGHVSLHGGVGGGILLRWRGTSRDLCFLGDDKARVNIFCAEDVTGTRGSAKALLAGDPVVDGFTWDAAGKRAAAIVSSPEHMHNVYLVEGGNPTRLTDIHQHTRDWAIPVIRVVRWTGKDATPVEGILELPPDYKAGSPLPLIVNLHGGPTSAWPCNMLFGYFGSVLFAGQGYAYFSPNYRGSTGYGDRFLKDLVGRQNDIEVQDIQAGIDHLIAEGIADKDRLAVAGWSNGGYLTNCLISKNGRFKAASSGAGITDATLEWGSNDEPAYQMVFNGGPPWQATAMYRRVSPIFEFGKVTTPTLFHVGEIDPRCPKGNSQMAFRALKDYLGVSSELLIYPGEPHGLSKYASRKAKMAWDLAWFDHYLKGKPKP